MKLKTFVTENGGRMRDYSQMDPRLLKVRPNFNIRDLTTPAAREKLDILKAQIKAEGVIEPLEIEFDGETPWINEGHRRHLMVMELIEEGEDIKTIPCIQERQGTSPAKRNLHMLMRKKEDYEPLEYATGIARQINVYGWDKGDLASALGFKSKGSIDGYLEMLGMTDAVKEQVAAGEVSATVALKVTRETRDAKTDPEFAAEIIAAAAAEQRRLGKKGRATPKAVKRVSERSKPKSDPPKPEPAKADTLSPEEKQARAEALGDAKAREQEQIASALAAISETSQPAPIMAENAEVEPAKTEPQTPAFSPLSDETPPAPIPEVHEQLKTVAAREFPAEAFQPPVNNRDFDREMFGIISRIAQFAEGLDLNEIGDSETLDCAFPVKILQDADRAYRKRISDTAEAA